MDGLLLGFDFGTRRIGVAAGNLQTRTAQGVTTLRVGRDGPDWREIDRLVAEWQPGALVIGLPRLADGQEAPLATGARRFGGRLGARYNLPVHFVDERLSTSEARHRLREAGTRGTRLRGARDTYAAELILQSFLEEPTRVNGRE
jgi:putative Holliday junction resolvase